MVGKPHVLVIDDDPDKLKLLEFALTRAGYQVRTAHDGEEGLAAIISFDPDLIVSDIMMPRMNGYELARRVRENPQTRFIPIILQTAAGSRAEDQRLGSEVGALGFITDPTDLDLLLARARTLLDFKAYLDTCEEQASTDHLTGLANRRRFERQLEREVARTARHGRPFSLITIDIDHFKQVNDTYGHEAGDEAIKTLARVLQQGTRGIDLAARIGGEEFAVILTETNLSGAVEVAERLRVALKSIEIQSVGQIAASFGVAECPSQAETARELVARADAALYEAKREGRDRVARASEVTSNSIVAGSVQ
ncbi:MAG TPA: diguanylate cyclase [Pyrinomonadaceae bacterium]|nr:diguanylate cyclase [Pyrinomonadaceae bacterium]